MCHYCNLYSIKPSEDISPLKINNIASFLQCFAKQIAQAPWYEVNLGVIAIAFHRLKMQLRSWSLLSSKIKTGGFQKCKIHCCNIEDFKATSLANPGFEPTSPAWVKREPFVTQARGVGSNPVVAKLRRLVTLKSLKLQQCISHFWKPPVFTFLDKRDQERSCIFRLWYAIVNTLRFTS